MSEFKLEIKQLKTKYLQAMRNYYDNSNLIFKMINEKIVFDNLMEVDLAFKTCMLNRFSDKRIKRWCSTDIAKAIQMLRARGIGCIHIASVINAFTTKATPMSDNHYQALNELKQIKHKLYSMAENSILTSDCWATDNNMDRFCKNGFNIGDYVLPEDRIYPQNKKE